MLCAALDRFQLRFAWSEDGLVVAEEVLSQLLHPTSTCPQMPASSPKSSDVKYPIKVFYKFILKYIFNKMNPLRSPSICFLEIISVKKVSHIFSYHIYTKIFSKFLSTNLWILFSSIISFYLLYFTVLYLTATVYLFKNI